MQRDWKTQKTCIEKQKSDYADERLAVFIIDIRSDRNERFNQRRIDNVIQHRQITPVSGKKWFHATDTCEFFCSRFSQMLPVAPYAAAIEARIIPRIIKRHHNTRHPDTFGGDVNLRRAWRDQKDWRGSNIPDFLRALPVRFHRIR